MDWVEVFSIRSKNIAVFYSISNCQEGLKGISLFFVEADNEGFSRTSIDRKMGWWCSDQATLYFDHSYQQIV